MEKNPKDFNQLKITILALKIMDWNGLLKIGGWWLPGKQWSSPDFFKSKTKNKMQLLPHHVTEKSCCDVQGLCRKEGCVIHAFTSLVFTGGNFPKLLEITQEVTLRKKSMKNYSAVRSIKWDTGR